MGNLSNFSERLKELMDERGLRSEKLAKEAGLAGSSIRSWLRGDSVPTYKSAIRLADHLRCSLDFLTGNSESDREILPREVPPFYPRLRMIMEEAGVTRFRLTTETPIKDAFFTNWAHGEEPLLTTLCTLADYLHVSLDYLVGRTDY